MSAVTDLKVHEMLSALLRLVEQKGVGSKERKAAVKLAAEECGVEVEDVFQERGSESGSWSDEVEAEMDRSSESGGSVEMPDGVSLGAGVRGINFGGLEEVYPLASAEVPKVTASDGVKRSTFYSQYVRVPKVVDVCKLLGRMSGEKLPKQAMVDVALSTYTAGTVPDVFENGKRRLRGLAAVGDAALTMHIVTLAVQSGIAVASVQAIRSAATSDVALSKAFVKCGFSKHTTLAPGVPVGAKTSATAVEVMVGLVALYCGKDAVARFVRELGVVAITP